MRLKRSVLLTIPTALLLTSCAGSRAPLVFQSACSSLVPATWLEEGVPSASLPTAAALAEDKAGAWREFGVAQTGQLDKANRRTPEAVGIIRRCEERDKAAIEKLTAPWWQFWRR